MSSKNSKNTINTDSQLPDVEENTGLTTEQQKKVIEKINNISKMRINLYQTLNSINSFFQNSLANSKGLLTEQTAAIDIVEKELNASKKRLQVLEEEKNNKIRLVEINNCYDVIANTFVINII